MRGREMGGRGIDTLELGVGRFRDVAATISGRGRASPLAAAPSASFARFL